VCLSIQQEDPSCVCVCVVLFNPKEESKRKERRFVKRRSKRREKKKKREINLLLNKTATKKNVLEKFQ
jgi:hypothetical protein